MATDKFEVVHDTPMLVGESATWHEVESALYWVDINGLTVNRVHPASGKFTSWKMGSEPSALAVDGDNNLVVATRHGLICLNTTSGKETPVADAPYDASIVRFNDGRVDPAGRFWIGTMYEPRDQPAAEMYVLERGRLRRAWAGGMTNSNGLAWSLDGRTMFHADTTSHRIDCYDFDPATGVQSNARTLLTFSTDKSAADYGGRPDGATLDSEGAYWVAMFEGGRVLRIAPDGKILRELALPVRCPTSVAFGGADLRTLYITSASHGRSAQELATYPLSGKVLSIRVDVAGREEPEYQPHP
ncbi:SMP-30/gluconolactonase/LRE family protein [Massilia sp. H6]|uniref:SMP-30/gluconolactonase/LRE family protein n=1 Tax=Massilia sp. H6 TaxID=2970464 RepID=UPI002168F4E7|nr:SMP-30/gluconolactonase/LRE family protein [Massilia sp. H6]UVW27841.1 SMP-30/gluconolactonase/LRE family protein [Massilia sp. H6]